MLCAQLHAPPDADADIVAAFAACARDLGADPEAIRFVESPAGSYTLTIHHVPDPAKPPA